VGTNKNNIMKKFIYKIRHIETGKFLETDYFPQAIDKFEEVIKEGKYNIWKGEHPGMGNILAKSHTGWKTPPRCTTKDYNRIGCEVVKYEIKEIEIEIIP
jgi:hypothetical protein